MSRLASPGNGQPPPSCPVAEPTPPPLAAERPVAVAGQPAAEYLAAAPPAGGPTPEAIAYLDACGVNQCCLQFYPDAGRPPRTSAETALTAYAADGSRVRIYPGDPPVGSQGALAATNESRPRRRDGRTALARQEAADCLVSQGTPIQSGGRQRTLAERAAQQAETTLHVTQPDIDIFLGCCALSPDFFAVARAQWHPVYWGYAESGPKWLWQALCDAADAGEGWSDTVARARMTEHLEREPSRMAGLMLQDHIDIVFSSDPAIGLIARVAATQLDDATLARGREVLQRLLYERGIAMPLHRALTQPFGGHRTDLPELLTMAAELQDRITQLDEPQAPRSYGELRRLGEAGQLVVTEIVTGLLARQGLAIWHSTSGLGKTLVATHMALSIATATPVLDYEPWSVPTPWRVCLYSTESGAEIVWRNLRNMLARKQEILRNRDEHQRAEEIVGMADRNLDIVTEWIPDLGNAASVARLCREIGENHYGVIILDPLFDALGSLADDLQNSSKIYRVLRPVIQKIHECGAQPVACHHDVTDRVTRESFETWPNPKAISFPVLRQIARQTISMKAGAEYQEETRTSTLKVTAIGKGNIAGGQFELRITEGEHYDRWESVVTRRRDLIAAERQGRAAGVGRQQARQLAYEDAVAAMIHRHNETGLTANQIWNTGDTKVPGVGEHTVHAVLQRCVVRRLIVRRGERYFSLQPATPQLSGHG